jgi:hypothetical protein
MTNHSSITMETKREDKALDTLVSQGIRERPHRNAFEMGFRPVVTHA